jgi:hypothetical protein
VAERFLFLPRRLQVAEWSQWSCPVMVLVHSPEKLEFAVLSGPQRAAESEQLLSVAVPQGLVLHVAPVQAPRVVCSSIMVPTIELYVSHDITTAQPASSMP